MRIIWMRLLRPSARWWTESPIPQGWRQVALHTDIPAAQMGLSRRGDAGSKRGCPPASRH